MALKSAKCESCGGNIEIDESRESGYCPYCGTQYYTEKIIQNTYITNNYAGAVINVQGVDVENYIQLIEQCLQENDFEKAKKYLDDAFLSDSNNEKLILLKIRALCSEIKTVSNFDTKFKVAILKKEIEVPNLGLKKIYKDIEVLLKRLNDNSFECVEKVCMNVFNDLFETRKVLYEFYEESFDRWCKSKDEKEKDYLKKMSHLSEGNLEDVTVSILDLICIPFFSNLNLDKALDIFMSEAKICKEKKEAYIFYSRFKLMLEMGGYTVPKIEVVNKKGKKKEAIKFGTFIVYYIKQKHSDYQSQTFSKFENYIKEEDQGGCFVATAVYGSYNCPPVWTLRRFRDYTLGKTWYGRMFIKTYYAISPTLVKWFGETSWFKCICRVPLDRLVNKLKNNGVSDLPYDDVSWK